jgi:sporulation protein YlmC with PRC-barrel domain
VADTTPYTIGTQASCTDGVCGQLSRVVVDPVARTVTHLVIQPEDHLELARLVPLDLVDAAADQTDQIRLRCSLEEFGRLKLAEEEEFIPGATVEGYGPEQVLGLPYYGLGPGVEGVGPDMVPMRVTYDTIPLGEVEVRRGEHVHATDGSIGRVQGLVIEPQSHHVTHVLLQEGHLWGKKEVAIPIRAVAKVDAEDGILLNVTKQQVQDLPPVDIDHVSP